MMSAVDFAPNARGITVICVLGSNIVASATKLVAMNAIRCHAVSIASKVYVETVDTITVKRVVKLFAKTAGTCIGGHKVTHIRLVRSARIERKRRFASGEGGLKFI